MDGAHPKAESFRRALQTPLRWPRITTRLLMILVALAAVGIWAAMNVPRAINETMAYQELAEYHARAEQKSSAMERESASTASAIQSRLDDWRRDTKGADELTEHYFVSRRDLYDNDAKYQREQAAHHANLKDRYRWESWLALVSTAPHAAPPTNPGWPPLAREPVKIFEALTEGGTTAAFSPSAIGLAVGQNDGTIRLLELPSRKLLVDFPLPERDAHFVIFSPDGKTLFALGRGRLVRRWDAATGRPQPPIPWKGQSPGQPGPLDYATAIACSPDGGMIAVASGGFMGKPSKAVSAVRALDTRTGTLAWEYRGTGSWAYCVAFSPDGKTLACAAKAAMLLDSRTGKLTKTWNSANGYVVAVAFSPDGRTLAGAGFDRTTASLGSGGSGRGISSNAATNRASVSGDTHRGESGRVTLWDVATGDMLRTLHGPTAHAMQVVFSPDGRTIAAGGTGPEKTSWEKLSGQRSSTTPSEVRLWDVATGRAIWTAEGECNAAFSLSFAPGGETLAFCDEDYVYNVDAHNGQPKQIVMETSRRARFQKTSPNPGTAVSGGRSSPDH